MKSATERFNIETRLAVGCAGLVYRAVERQTNFPVALKLLLGEEIGHPLDAAALRRDAAADDFRRARRAVDRRD